LSKISLAFNSLFRYYENIGVTMARPKGVKQKKNPAKYWLPEGVTLKYTEEYYVKETKLTFIDSIYGEFTSTYKDLQLANKSLHPEAISKRKSQNNPGASPEARQKAKSTMLLRYGVENALENPIFTQKSKETLLKNHGVDHPMKSQELRQRQKLSTFENYGVYNPAQSEVVKTKIRATNMKIYGVDNPSKSAVVQQKIFESFDKVGHEGKVSEGEIELRDYIRSLGFTTRKKFVGGRDPFSIDIYIEELKVGIEYNGGYWHRHDLKKDYMYHRNKTDIAAEKGIRVIHVFDYHWLHQQDKVKSVLKSILNKNETRIFARKCKIKVVTSEAANQFLDMYHLLGTTKSNNFFGLYYDNELVSVVAFKRHHRGTGELLLSRFCVKSGVTVVGGLSRLVKYSKEQLKESFSTFIDLTYARPDNWIKTGWVELSRSKPDYFYYSSNGAKYVSKQSMSGKEKELPSGLYKVFDCGKVKLRFT
jgi:hypothetical protein